MSNDVGVNMLGEVEANRKPARTGPLRVVIGNTRNSREVREPDGHRSGATLQMRRPRQRSGFGGGRKRAFQQDALRMRGSESRMNPTISPVEHLNGFSAQGRFFRPSSGAWLGPPSYDPIFSALLARRVALAGCFLLILAVAV